ncbi:MAG: flavin reductase family protein [Alphaproteobacteria bacterium]|nr:flavin reductase family protein [Alphaproteobacteria bacterium]MBM3613560.1 flavin reductase family protein [Alphaproteobacteria bacterium]
MFYETATMAHGLSYDPFKACVAPRPIGWLTTLSREGIVNLAPYSFFNAVAEDPPMVMFATTGRDPHGPKDTLRNIEATGEFVFNLATYKLREQMNRTSAPVPPEVDELSLAGLTPVPSRLVKPPRVAESPIHLECVYHQTIELPSNDPEERNAVGIGRVVGVHIADEVIRNGRVDLSLVRPIARLGYHDFTVVETIFEMRRPRA